MEESQNIPQPSPAPMPENNWFKFFLLGIFVIILASGLVLGGYYFGRQNSSTIPTPTPPKSTSISTPTPDLTANWKTYVNNKYGYSLKYEPNRELKELSCGEKTFEKGERWFYLDKVGSNFPECGAGSFNPPVDITVNDYNQSCNSDENYTMQKSTVIVIGINSIKCEGEFINVNNPNPQIFPKQIYFTEIPYKGKVYHLSLGDLKYINTYNQILSTFRFTQ